MDIITLRFLLRLISYYATFLSAPHNLRAPLNELLRKRLGWNWGHKCEKAFTKLKDTLISDNIHSYYNPDLPIIEVVDASNHGIGIVIYYVFPDSSEKAVAQVS